MYIIIVASFSEYQILFLYRDYIVLFSHEMIQLEKMSRWQNTYDKIMLFIVPHIINSLLIYWYLKLQL